MKTLSMLKSISLLILLATLFFSCEQVLSTNYPGLSKSPLPKEWEGHYEIAELAGDAYDSSDTRTYITIKSKEISFQKENEQRKTYSLGDSLIYSVLNNTHYISFLEHQGLYTVAKIVKRGDNLEVYSLCTEDETPVAEMSKYFNDVERIGKQGDDDIYYKVTIVDSKLDSYFKSKVPSRDFCLLKPVK